ASSRAGRGLGPALQGMGRWPPSGSRDRTDARWARGPDAAHDAPHHAVASDPQEAKRTSDARSGARQQSVAEEGPGAATPCFDRGAGDLERAGQLGCGELVNVAQLEDEPVLFR